MALVSISKVLLFQGALKYCISMYHRKEEKEREIYFFEQKLDPCIYYFDCVLIFFPVYKIKISNIGSAVVKNFFKE